MGIRANALTDHRVLNFRNQEAVLSLLTPTLPAVASVVDYWRATQADYTETVNAWSALLIQNPVEGEFLRYHGPAAFSVGFGIGVAKISGPCRWSGFCTIPLLQLVHAAAFREISRAIGGERMVLIPDYDPVYDAALYDGSSLDE